MEPRRLGALEGILVVTLEQAVAAPLCSCRLADAGARVIKIERAEGDFARGYDATAKGQSSYFVWLNRGKESIVLDFKQPDDAALLARMIAKADIYIENLAPGAAARAGFGVEELCRRHPRLIGCTVAGYGGEGPYAARKAYDLLVQAESGMASVTGGPEQPGRVGVSIVDIATGMNAFGAIVSALYARDRAGRGAVVTASLFDTAAELMAVPLLQTEGGKPPERVGLHHPTIAPYGIFRAGDGGAVLLSIQNEREWRAFCGRVVMLPELATDPRFNSGTARVANRDLLEQIVEQAFAVYSRDGLVKALMEADIAFGSLNTPADLAHHPHLQRLDVATENGTVSVPAPPARIVGSVPANPRVPKIGEHSEAIRREFAS